MEEGLALYALDDEWNPLWLPLDAPPLRRVNGRHRGVPRALMLGLTGGLAVDGFGRIESLVLGDLPPYHLPGSTALWEAEVVQDLVLGPWSAHNHPAGWIVDCLGGVHPIGEAADLSWAPERRLDPDVVAGAVEPSSTLAAGRGATLTTDGQIASFGWGPSEDEPHLPPVHVQDVEDARELLLAPAPRGTPLSGWIRVKDHTLHPFGSAPAHPTRLEPSIPSGQGLISGGITPDDIEELAQGRTLGAVCCVRL